MGPLQQKGPLCPFEHAVATSGTGVWYVRVARVELQHPGAYVGYGVCAAHRRILEVAPRLKQELLSSVTPLEIYLLCQFGQISPPG